MNTLNLGSNTGKLYLGNIALNDSTGSGIITGTMPKDGMVYIYTTEDEYILSSYWQLYDGLKEPVGIYYGTDEHLVLIGNVTSLGNYVHYIYANYTDGDPIPGVSEYSTSTEALQDFNGLLNTIALNSMPSEYGYIDTGFSYSIFHGKNSGKQPTYVPSIGELHFAFSKKNIWKLILAAYTVAFDYDLVLDFVSSTKVAGLNKFYSYSSSGVSTKTEGSMGNIGKAIGFMTPGKLYKWYGVYNNSSNGLFNTATRRTGINEYHKTLPIQSKMRGCTITSDGIIKYLNPNDWTKYEDGTDRDYTLNTMVEIPLFYYSVCASSWRISEEAIPGWIKSEKMYVGAYEGVIQDGILKSICPKSKAEADRIYPTSSVENVGILHTAARANGNNHWNMYTYMAHKAICILYVVEYASTNILLGYNEKLTTEGYKLGGLAPTSYPFDNYNKFANPIWCGYTDSSGNGSSGRYTIVVGSASYATPRYRGIEMPYYNFDKVVIDLYNATDVSALDKRGLYQTKDYTRFSYLSYSPSPSDFTYHKYKFIGVIHNKSYIVSNRINLAPNGLGTEFFVGPSDNSITINAGSSVDGFADTSNARYIGFGGNLANKDLTGLFNVSIESYTTRLTYLDYDVTPYQ